MLARYSRPEMVEIWSDHTKYSIWLEIELLVLEAFEKNGDIPQGIAKRARQNAKFNIAEIDELEKTLHHDMIAFLTNISTSLGTDSRFVHKGLTSSDIYDTCFAVQMSKAINLLSDGIDEVLIRLKALAHKHKYSFTIGRTHGVHAEPTTFGLKLAQAYAELQRCKSRLWQALNEISICAISGAVGNYANVSPSVEQYVANALGFQVETISSQVVPRDRHAFVFSVYGILAGCIERIVTEIRHLQRTEVRELEEPFGDGQKGSSAMPHKKNPVLTENLTGLCRIVKSAVAPSIDNIVLWHERDISHSSVERYTAPDVTITLDFILHRLLKVFDGLSVDTDKMLENIYLSKGTIFSQRVLLGLIDKGMSREDSYFIVQKHALNVWRNLDTEDFKLVILADRIVQKHLNKEEIEDLFSLDYYVQHVDHIFERVFTP